ncbi:MAG TPA: hypothetical protein VEC13_00855 [Candidatus Paceibacterota bacterium]|nr:hypothetical protein [Candidatus Paceibacterota bacterium]
MNGILFWLISFIFPALLTGIALKLYSKHSLKREAIIIHAGLLVSIVVSQISILAIGSVFLVEVTPLSILCFALSIGFGYFLLRDFGVFYGLSALLQQLALISSASLLFSYYFTWPVIFLLVPIFAFGHGIGDRFWYVRVLILILWGIGAILLFLLTGDLLLVAAIHTFFGTLLIRSSLFYQNRKAALDSLSSKS